MEEVVKRVEERSPQTAPVIHPGFELLQERRRRRILKRYESFSPSHYTVLLIEPEAAPRESIAELLRSIGFRVAATESAGEGLAVMVRRFVDVVICALRLPDMCGCEVSRSLKGLRCVPEHSPIPVILLSEESQKATTLALRSGADLVCLRERVQTMLIPQVLFLLQ